MTTQQQFNAIHTQDQAESRARCNSIFWHSDYAVVRILMVDMDDPKGHMIPEYFDIPASEVNKSPWNDPIGKPVVVAIYDAMGIKRF